MITLAAFVVLQVAWSFLALMYLAENRCGGEGHPAPVDGSARASYCDNFVEATDKGVDLLLFFFWPIPFLLVGGIWAITRGSSAALRGAILVALVWPLAYTLPGVFLSAG